MRIRNMLCLCLATPPTARFITISEPAGAGRLWPLLKGCTMNAYAVAVPEKTVVSQPHEIVKRDGVRGRFDPDKIASAIFRAGCATGEFGEFEANLIAAQVVKVLSHKYCGDVPAIEGIQDVVEHALIAANHF